MRTKGRGPRSFSFFSGRRRGTMHPLFKQLIYKTKTRRWFELLGTLEEDEHVRVNSLVAKTHCTRRTILNDVKELKAYFGSSILWIGDETGYHFSLQDPYAYEQKKQELLAEERLFVFLYGVTSGDQFDNGQWAKVLGVPSASFGRMKHQIQTLFIQHYQVRLDPETNILVGEEASIRQLLYDFYFLLPTYPETLTESISQIRRNQIKIRKGEWQLDEQRLNQWGVIVQIRMDQGHELPKRSDVLSLETPLVQAFDRQVDSGLPIQEKAALFLLALEEEQFLNPLIQKQFLRAFSATSAGYWLVRADEGLAYQFLGTYLSLMRLFFQLPVLYTNQIMVMSGQEEAVVLDQFMRVFLQEKENYHKALYVTYRLSGSKALKRWIKKEVEAALVQAGRVVVDAPDYNQPLFLRHLEISNGQEFFRKKGRLWLPQIPRKEEIQQAIAQSIGEGL